MVGLLRTVSFLILLLVVGLVAIIGLTYRNTNRFASLFAQPDGTTCETPCLFGLDRTTLTFEQAEQAVAALPALAHAERTETQHPHFVAYESSQLEVRIEQSDLSQTVILIVIFPLNAPTPSIGSLVTLLGKPERIALQRDVDGSPSAQRIRTSTLILPNCAGINLLIRGQWIGLSSSSKGDCLTHWSRRVDSITIFLPDENKLNPTTAWHGFSTDSFYLAPRSSPNP